MKNIVKKAIKITVAVISALLVLLVTIPLLATLLINLPGVQNMVARRFMSAISENLGTRVSVDRIRVKLINRVELEGFYVEDLRGDTLLYSKKIIVPVVEPGLFGKPLTFGRVSLGDTEMWLRRDSLGEINIRELILAVRGDREPDSESNFGLHIHGVDAPNLTFGLLRWDKPLREGVDFSRFVIRNSNIDLDRLAITGDTVRIGIRSFSFDERSGFHMDRFSARELEIRSGKVLLDNVKIEAEGARLNLPYIRIEGHDWYSYRDFLDSVAVNVAMERSVLPASMAGWFLPAVKGWGVTFNGLSLTTSGPIARYEGEIQNAEVFDSSFSLAFRSRGIPDFGNMRLEAEVRNLKTNAADADTLMRNITGRPIPENIAPLLGRLGGATVNGRFEGGLKDFKASGIAVSEIGDVLAGVAMARNGEWTKFDAQIEVPGFDAGRLLDVGRLGFVSGAAGMRGRIGRNGRIEGDIDGSLNSIWFNGYNYRGVSFDGRLDGRMFDGAIRSRDRAMTFDFEGMLDFNDSIPRYNFDLDLRRADLAATRIFTRDSVALLSARIDASASGLGLDDLNGRIDVRQPVYIAPADTIRTELISLAGRNSPQSKLVTFTSDFADAEFRSRINYRDMFGYLRGFLRDYIPLLYEDGEQEPPAHGDYGLADASGYSVLNLHVKDTDKLLDVFAPGAHLAAGTEASFMFNPFVRSFSMSAHSDFIEYKNMLVTDLDLNSDNKTDSLKMYLTAGDFYRGTLHIPNLAVHGGARGRRMTLTTRLSDQHKKLSALIGLRIDSENGGGRSIRFRFNPSYLTFDNRTWFFSANSISYSKPGITVDNFRIHSGLAGNEELSVNGVISGRESDTLSIRLNRFDLAPVGQLTESAGYHPEGRATGYINFVSVFERPRFLADIDLEKLSLNGAKASPLRFLSYWDRNAERVRFRLTDRASDSNVLRGSLAPQTGNIDAVAAIDRLDAALLDPLLKNTLEKTAGEANARLEIGGTLRNLRLDGRIEVPHFETTVRFTQAKYLLENGVIEVKDSRLSLPATLVRDPFGNTADFSLGVDLSNMRNVGFDIRASTRNLLAFNTRQGDNEAFYGQVFATGSLSIRGDKMGTKMNISATTGRGSKFSLPLNAKSNISWADFVVFTDPVRGVDSTNVLERKKLIYERRLSAGEGRRAKPLDLDMTIDLTPEAEFQMMIDPNLGNGITARGQGIINMRVNPATNLFSMVGDCNISSGRFELSMMNVFNKDFTITPGSTLVWTGEPEDALLDVEGIYRVRTSLTPLIGTDIGTPGRSMPVDCIVRLSGRLSQPDITFDVRIPSADIETQARVANAMNTQELKSTQFLSLLIMGSFVPGSSIGQAGTASSGSVGFDLLANQLSNILSTEDYNIYFRYTPQNETTGRGSEFDVGFSKGFIDNRLILEIEGNYVDDRASTGTGTGNVSNLAGNVSLTWVIDRSGNLRLKVFSQTIDRWNETQGEQESGIGIYYKKDFDTFRDVWEGVSDTFTTFDRRRRAERKEERRERSEVAPEEGAGESAGKSADGGEISGDQQ